MRWYCWKCDEDTDFVTHRWNIYIYVCKVCGCAPCGVEQPVVKQGPLKLVRRPRNEPY